MAWDREPADVGVETELLHPLLAGRWSSRVYDPEHSLDPADLRVLLEAARWSPSAGNSQPWAFIVGLRGDRTHRRFVSMLSRGNSFWAPRASALLLTLHRTGIDASPDGVAMPYSDYAAYDLGQAAAHLTVQAAAMGLAVHQFAGFDHERARIEFGVPDHWRVTTGIAVGTLAPVESIAEQEPSLVTREQLLRRRNPQSDFVFASEFGKPMRDV